MLLYALLAIQRKSLPLPFDARYLPLLGLGLAVLAWVPFLSLMGRTSGWRRLAHLYPRRNSGTGRSFRCSPILMRMSNYRGGARLTPDDGQAAAYWLGRCRVARQLAELHSRGDGPIDGQGASYVPALPVA